MNRLGPTVRILLLAGMMSVVAAVAIAEQHEAFSQLALNDYGGRLFRASSTLEAQSPFDLGTYGMHTLFDGDASTGWSEGVEGPGVGEVLWLAIPDDADTLIVQNGFARTRRLFEMNNRVRSVGLSLWRGLQPDGMVSELAVVFAVSPVSRTYSISLQDRMEPQEFGLPFQADELLQARSVPEQAFRAYAEAEGIPPQIAYRRSILRLEITAVYPGTTWDDTCLTELWVGTTEE